MEDLALSGGYLPVAWVSGDAGRRHSRLRGADRYRPSRPRHCDSSRRRLLICPEHPEADPATGAVHACGHNAQSAYLVGCAAALGEPGALDGLCGSIRFLSIPAEETIDLEYRSKLIQEGTIHYLAGKIEFLYRGLFDGVQLVLFTHVLSEETSLFAIDKGADGCITKHLSISANPRTPASRRIRASTPSMPRRSASPPATRCVRRLRKRTISAGTPS